MERGESEILQIQLAQQLFEKSYKRCPQVMEEQNRK